LFGDGGEEKRMEKAKINKVGRRARMERQTAARGFHTKITGASSC